ncbi:MAG: uroporphyrinogen-III synthase [Porticoccaceae bacterium]|nr:uroporphyrinogen-III synthase [Porticoccaceae bacterium]
MVGKRVLVVRAQRDSDEFLALLQRAGSVVDCLPIMSIQPLEESPEIKRAILDFDLNDRTIFISVYAARLGLHWIDQYWPMLPLGMAYFAVGNQTAKVLRDSGCDVTTPHSEFTTEGLLAMPELQDLEGRRVLIFCGSGGRQKLADSLLLRGARVDSCALYRRCIKEQNLQLARAQLAQTDCLVVHSGQLLQALAAPPAKIAARLSLVVPSPRLGAMAEELGYRRVEIAQSAAPLAMYAATKTVLQTLRGA